MAVNPAEKPQPSFSSNEKDVEICTTKDGNIQSSTEIADQDEDYPDGGLRAWLIVLGVCIALKYVGVYLLMPIPLL